MYDIPLLCYTGWEPALNERGLHKDMNSRDVIIGVTKGLYIIHWISAYLGSGFLLQQI